MLSEQELSNSIQDGMSIINDVNLQQVSATMHKIEQFQAVVQKMLKKDHDYGIIPGTGSKPTLLKPGAEKILMLMGLTSEYQIVEKVQDYENGFFAFTVKCTLSKGSIKVTEGVGHANTREKRYTSGRRQDPYTLANTVLKIAKKRAQVDAVLTVASLSEIFTQDLEDDILDEMQKPAQQQLQPKITDKATDAQLKKIYVMSKELNIQTEVMKNLIKEKYNKENSKELSKQEASDLIEILSEMQALQSTEPYSLPWELQQ